MDSPVKRCHLCDEYRYNRCDECNAPICEKHANVRGNLVYCDTCLPWSAAVQRWSEARRIAQRVAPRFMQYAAVEYRQDQPEQKAA